MLQVWFDGGTGPDADEIGPLLKEIAPHALCHNDVPFNDAGAIRWMGNEEGNMPLPSCAYWQF